jgi:hypothetical protein
MAVLRCRAVAGDPVSTHFVALQSREPTKGDERRAIARATQ